MNNKLTSLLRCSRCSKECYGDQKTAEQALTDIRADPAATRIAGEKVPERAYRAPCGFWHLTSKPAVQPICPTCGRPRHGKERCWPELPPPFWNIKT